MRRIKFPVKVQLRRIFIPLPRDTGPEPPLLCRGEGVISKSFFGTFGESKGDSVPLRRARLLAQKHSVVLDIELFEQIAHGEVLFLLAPDVDDDAARIHHDQTVAVLDGVLHVVRDHHGGEVVARNDLLGDLKHLVCGLRVERRSVFVEQQQIRLAQRRHQQRQRLTLTAGEQADLARHAVLQTQTERRELLTVELALLVRDAGMQTAPLTAAVREREVLLDAHGRGRTHHRVLEHTAEIFRALVLGQMRQVEAVKVDRAGIHRENARDQVERGGLAGAVAADDRDKIAVFQRQIEVVNRTLLIDRSGVERLVNTLEFEHVSGPPSWS